MSQRASIRTRPARFRVPNNERVILSIGTERFPGTLNVLSMTGGALRIARRPNPGTFAEIQMHTITGNIHAVIELLVMRGDSNQAFRFVQIDNSNRKRLQDALEKLEAQGLGDKKADPLQHVIRFAKKLIPQKS